MKTIKLALIALSLISFSTSAFSGSINYEIKKEIKKTLKSLNSDPQDDYQYINNYKKVIAKRDLNRDGRKDVVVELGYCEKTACHKTTRFYSVVVFKGIKKNNYRYFDKVGYSFDGKVKVKKGKIIVSDLDYYTDNNDPMKSDPSCCPSLKTKTIYKMKKKKLVKIGKHVTRKK